MASGPRAWARDIIMADGYLGLIGDGKQGIRPIFAFDATFADMGAGGSAAISPAAVPFDAEILSIISVITTGVTSAASNITIGLSGDTDAYASGIEVPIAAAGEVHGTSVDNMTGVATIPAGTEVLVTHDGAPAAGAASVTLYLAPIRMGGVIWQPPA